MTNMRRAAKMVTIANTDGVVRYRVAWLFGMFICVQIEVRHVCAICKCPSLF